MNSGARHRNDRVVRTVETAGEVFTGGGTPGEAGYVRRGPGGEIGLRLGERGDPGIDRAVARKPVRERSEPAS